ncbi:outer dynein arm-docking complex subunit 3 isoform X1 [Monodelphis domestica]|uniref:Outer dynein arm docking complex subunit 3 n=1 Tax=Monodelphis domestica TaxID=13616 RepID=F7GEQ9_MONDO|nr:outer dynein arm-docking complex subunit 3 isoform X1 [Monodelphis domestica]XP_056678678.1 outer dynein arm-docking complex subunit 3 isoform X1 [Monodelphis domestica]XP_056678679.1 outer dynein arm-docking complex subunit 3 isoform X1 [Monodelphis domestica]XP_056678680.1 outer dynein arm-docking complex subunit 3 isoform X1 [Monodelphis domestica]
MVPLRTAPSSFHKPRRLASRRQPRIPSSQPPPIQAGVKPPIHVQISELHRKIQLLEGDRKSFYESTQWTIKKNKQTIKHLREENKISYHRLSDMLSGEEKVVRWVIKEWKDEKSHLRNKNGEEALALVDHRLNEKMKQLNSLRHEAELKQRRIEELQLQHSLRALETNELRGTDTEVAKTTRNLENRLEKAKLKGDEAENITKVYLQLKAYMQDESLNFENKLDAMEAEVIRLRREFSELQVVNHEAEVARDSAKSQLQKLEENLFKDRKEREKVMLEAKKRTEEKKLLNERIERKTQHRDHIPLRSEEIVDMQGTKADILKGRWHMFQTEIAFDRIKEATGVADPNSVVRRFLAQGDAFTHLESLRKQNDLTLAKLRQEKKHLQQELTELKYAGETKAIRNDQFMAELQTHVSTQEKQVAAAKEDLESTIRSLLSAKAGVEHLAIKLQPITVEKSQFAKKELNPNAPDYVLDLMAQNEEKLLQLQSDMEGHDVPDLLHHLTEQEYYASLEGKLPAFNTRISLPSDTTKDKFFDEEESEDETGEIVTRAALKFQSQKLIESRSKKRGRSRRRS